jgi:type I restriction-modification system DNA methylase subunit
MSASNIDWRTTRDLLELEDRFREKLADTLKDIKRNYRFGEYEINDVSMSWEVQGRRPDITVFVQNQPFLIIECKRAIEHSPWDDFPIGQAYTYALLAKKEGYSVDFVATANQYYMAIFRVPEDLEDYANWEAIRRRLYDRAFKRELYLKARAGDLCVIDVSYHFVPSKEKLYEVLKKLIEERREIKPEPFRYRVIRRLKSFVDFLAEVSKDLITLHIKNNLQNEFLALRKRRGVSLTYEQIAKEFAYSIMNRILFYKVLEGSWKGLEKLEPLYGKEINGVRIDDGEKYFRVLKTFFKRVVDVTGDFEPVFILDFHDKLILPSYVSVLKAIDGLIQDLDNIELDRLGDVIGYVYEEIIDPEERHQLGQFYTPHGVAEFIVKWCIRSQSDLVLDPGSGSGTFLVEAYRRLYELNTGKKLEGIAEENIHEQIIKQLYAIDIDEFACHLTAMNISMKNVLNPSREINVIPSDFFLRDPEQEVLLSYKVLTVKGLEERKIRLPKFDCVVGNPPYTAWDEIQDNTKKLIREKLDRLSEKYSLKPRGGVRQRQNPHIYVYWLMHATKFLKPNGRLGMIISNLWLQTDYGVKFGNFLLDNFKIKAIIDIPLRLFTALITTTILLLERCDDKKERDENDVVFIRIPTSVEDVDVEELLNAINNKRSDKFPVNCIKQREISRSGKWIKYFFKSVLLLEKSPKSCPLSDLYDVCKGNTTWHILTNGAGDGATPFFHLTPEIVERENLHGYVYPAITDVRDMKFFTFKRRDWEILRDKNKRCYMFICHKPRSELDQNILRYIEWGERDCRVSRRRGQGEICSRTSACRNREERNEFYGWYDLGGVKPAQILAVYQAWYKTRFALCEFPVATYHAILCFFPKVELTKDQLKALLAYLNSSFAQFYVETEGRKSGGGIIALEISQAERMPVLDPRKLNDDEVKRLAELFDKLESKAREIGGATERDQIEQLKPIIHEIDREIGKILGLSDLEVYAIQNAVDQLIERRIAGAREVRRHAIRGEEEIPELEESDEEISNNNQTTLTEFLGE